MLMCIYRVSRYKCIADLENVTVVDSSDQFSCALRNMSLLLDSGHLYSGQTSKAMLPHGSGIEWDGPEPGGHKL